MGQSIRSEFKDSAKRTVWLYTVTVVFLFSFMAYCGSPAKAHWEDPQNCNKANQRIMDDASFETTYEGISEDGRDYIARGKSKNTGAMIEEHYNLYPQAQWKDKDTPAYSDQVLSVWLDWDGNGTFGEFYLFPRGVAKCGDALHFIWTDQFQTYLLYAKGKERT